MIDETEQIRKMYREIGSNPDLFSDDIFYFEFDNIADIRRNLPEIGRRFKFEPGEQYKRIMGKCVNSTKVEVMLPHKRAFLFTDSTSVIGAIPKEPRIKTALENTTSVNIYAFGEVYYKDKGYVLFQDMESLLILAIDDGKNYPDLLRQDFFPSSRQPLDLFLGV